jgi:hypothetical protein
MITLTIEKVNGFLNFDPAFEAMTIAAKDEIKSLLRNGGSVEWGDEDSEDGNCPRISTDRGTCEVRKVYEDSNGDISVEFSNNNDVEGSWELNDLLMSEQIALYESVFHKVIEGKKVQ